MLLRIESKDCCILLAHAVPLTNGRTQTGFVYSSGRKSQFQLCLRFFICLIWFICHLSSLQRHFIMVSFLMSIYLSANTPSVLDCSHFLDNVRDSWMLFPFWRLKSAKFVFYIIVDVRIYGCHLPI